MFTNTVSNKWTETAKEIEATIELIVFNLGEVSIGIPMIKIDRVVNKTNLERLAVCLDAHNSEVSSESMRRCDSNRDFSLSAGIEILDLHQRLFGTSLVNPTAMVVLKGWTLTGIPIDTTPTLIAVPLDRIRILPTGFRTNSPLGIASHVAMISIDDNESTIFILE